MEITYTQQGDYLLPNLTLPEQDKRPIGLWGQQHLRYIKRCRPILYTNMLTNDEDVTYADYASSLSRDPSEWIDAYIIYLLTAVM